MDSRLHRRNNNRRWLVLLVSSVILSLSRNVRYVDSGGDDASVMMLDDDNGREENSTTVQLLSEPAGINAAIANRTKEKTDSKQWLRKKFWRSQISNRDDHGNDDGIAKEIKKLPADSGEGTSSDQTDDENSGQLDEGEISQESTSDEDVVEGGEIDDCRGYDEYDNSESQLSDEYEPALERRRSRDRDNDWKRNYYGVNEMTTRRNGGEDSSDDTDSSDSEDTNNNDNIDDEDGISFNDIADTICIFLYFIPRPEIAAFCDFLNIMELIRMSNLLIFFLF